MGASSGCKPLPPAPALIHSVPVSSRLRSTRRHRAAVTICSLLYADACPPLRTPERAAQALALGEHLGVPGAVRLHAVGFPRWCGRLVCLHAAHSANCGTLCYADLLTLLASLVSLARRACGSGAGDVCSRPAAPSRAAGGASCCSALPGWMHRMAYVCGQSAS